MEKWGMKRWYGSVITRFIFILLCGRYAFLINLIYFYKFNLLSLDHRLVEMLSTLYFCD